MSPPEFADLETKQQYALKQYTQTELEERAQQAQEYK